MSSKTSVLIAGITGRTGSTIAHSLMRSGVFTVIGAVRPSSLEKPSAQALAKAGVELRSTDFEADTPEQLEKLLAGVDVLIITVLINTDQKPLLRAAKAVGSLIRVIPSDFGTVAPRGVMKMHDTKLDIREFVQELGLPYTFVEVGWWLELSFPTRHADKAHPVSGMVNSLVEEGKQPFAMTALHSVGEFMVRILQDSRTLNKTTLVWDWITTQEETWAIGQKITGEDFADYPRLSKDQLQANLDAASDPRAVGVFEYHRSLWVRGDNTIINAKEQGSMDARELYPDYVPGELEDAARANVYDKTWPPFLV